MQNAPEKIALEARSDLTVHPLQCTEGANSLLGSGGCCGVETESAVADIRDNPHEHNTSVDLHQDPATSTSHSNKSEGSTCKQDSIQDKRSWFMGTSIYESKDNLGACSKSGSISNDDISITSFDELTHNDCMRSCRNSINEDMEPLPPPAAFVDSATNTELVYENEKPESKTASRSCSSKCASPVLPTEVLSRSCSASRASLNKFPEQNANPSQSYGPPVSVEERASDTKVNSALMLGSGLTYGRPTRVGYPYLLSTFHPMIPKDMSVQKAGCSGSSSSSSSEECVASLMRQPIKVHDPIAAKPQQTRPWTVGGPYFLQSTSYLQSDDSWSHAVEDIRSDRSGIRSATSSSETQSKGPSRSQSPLLSTAKSHPKTK